MTDKDIVDDLPAKRAKLTELHEEEVDTSDKELSEEPLVTGKDATQAMQIVKKYIQQQGITSLYNVSERLEMELFQSVCVRKSQIKITSFFK